MVVGKRLAAIHHFGKYALDLGRPLKRLAFGLIDLAIAWLIGTALAVLVEVWLAVASRGEHGLFSNDSSLGGAVVLAGLVPAFIWLRRTRAARESRIPQTVPKILADETRSQEVDTTPDDAGSDARPAASESTPPPLPQAPEVVASTRSAARKYWLPITLIGAYLVALFIGFGIRPEAGNSQERAVNKAVEEAFGKVSREDLDEFLAVASSAKTWNEIGARYTAAAYDQQVGLEEFITIATDSHQRYAGLIVEMHARTNRVENPKLRSLLIQLTDLYRERLEGVKLISAGIIQQDNESIERGNRRIAVSIELGTSLLKEQLGPILAAVGVDLDEFARLVTPASP